MTRDQFLTEKVLGELWHEWKGNYCTCGQIGDIGSGHIITNNNNFSEWEYFGKLWNFCKEQEWWKDFLKLHAFYKLYTVGVIAKTFIDIDLINPDTFADAISRYRGWEGE